MEQFIDALLFLALVGFSTSGILFYAYKNNQKFPSYCSNANNLTWGLRILGLSTILLVVYLFTI